MKMKETEIDEEKAILTIVLSDHLPRLEKYVKRWFVDGRQIWSVNVREILKADGHKVEQQDVIERTFINEIDGIKIASMNNGTMVKPKDPTKYEALKLALCKLDLFFHRCYLPKTR